MFANCRCYSYSGGVRTNERVTYEIFYYYVKSLEM